MDIKESVTKSKLEVMDLMEAERYRIRKFALQILVYHLFKYQQLCGIQVSQSSISLLLELLDLEVVQVDSPSDDATAASIEELEAFIYHFLEQFANFINQLFKGQNCSGRRLKNEQPKPDSYHQNHDSASTIHHRDESSLITLSPKSWSEGIVTNELIARLQTNPTTLKKYLRDLKKLQWAAERDPEGLGWIYDPLLERYYPVRISLENSHTEISEKTLPEDNWPSVQDHGFATEHEADCRSCDGRRGLTQSQLSRLTDIPIPTLQRWKSLPDFSERIRRRTEGAFTYWYSHHNRSFYPFRVDL